MDEMRYTVRPIDPVVWDQFCYQAWGVQSEDINWFKNHMAKREKTIAWCTEQFGEPGANGDSARWYFSPNYGVLIRDTADALAFRLRWS